MHPKDTVNKDILTQEQDGFWVIPVLVTQRSYFPFPR